MLSNRQANDLADLDRRLRDLERQADMLPARPTPNAYPRISTIIILRGNKILDADTYYGTIYGCKVPASGITAVPTAIPGSGGLGTYADGLCAGSYYNGSTTGLVWVSTKIVVDGTTITDSVGTLVEGMIIQSRYAFKLPITGGGGTTAKVYLPWYLG
jgi:hypothetical protein